MRECLRLFIELIETVLLGYTYHLHLPFHNILNQWIEYSYDVTTDAVGARDLCEHESIHIRFLLLSYI
jgi:hypothetical protein